MILSKTRFIFGGHIIVGSGGSSDFNGVGVTFRNTYQDYEIGVPLTEKEPLNDHHTISEYELLFLNPKSIDVLLYHLNRAKKILMGQVEINNDADSFWE